MRRSPVILIAVLLAFGLGAAGVSAASGRAGGRQAGPAGLEGIPGFGHVFLLIGENTSLAQVNAKDTPYIAETLKPHAAWLTSYTGVHSGSLSDYIAMTSGQYRPCDVNDDFPYNPNTNKPACAQNISNLFRQLDTAHVSWLEWNESMPNPCAFFDTGTDWAKDIYTTHHDPAVYYTDLEGGRYFEDYNKAPNAECLHQVIATGGTGPNDMSRFNAALARGRVPRFNMVIPNGCEQGHDPCGTSNPPGQFDAFLRREVPKIEASPAFGANGLILITYDEWGDATPHNHRVAFLAIGAQVRPGIYGGAFSHYSLLRTLEDGFGIGQHLRNAAHAQPISQIWKS
jgi:hypothetical protein